MKDHTPLKRHQAIVSFSKDHHFGLLLVWKIRQGLKHDVVPERISNYVSFFFKEDLEKHFRDEEQMLFSRLPADDMMRKHAEADHQSIYNLVAAIEGRKDDKDLLIQFADELEKHIRFEERELFNHLQKNIPEDDLAIIEMRFSNNSKEIAQKWNDVFWENK
jgi:iron-sulfur cluster repair protein YtfE (RIC family)